MTSFSDFCTKLYENALRSRDLFFKHKQMYRGLNTFAHNSSEEITASNVYNKVRAITGIGTVRANRLAEFFLPLTDATRLAQCIIDEQTAHDQIVRDAMAKREANGDQSKKDKKKEKKKQKSKKKPISDKAAQEFVPKLVTKKKKLTAEQRGEKKADAISAIFESGALEKIKNNKRHQVVYFMVLLHTFNPKTCTVKAAKSLAAEFFGKFKSSMRPSAKEYVFLSSGNGVRTISNNKVIDHVKSIADTAHITAAAVAKSQDDNESVAGNASDDEETEVDDDDDDDDADHTDEEDMHSQYGNLDFDMDMNSNTDLNTTTSSSASNSPSGGASTKNRKRKFPATDFDIAVGVDVEPPQKKRRVGQNIAMEPMDQNIAMEPPPLYRHSYHMDQEPEQSDDKQTEAPPNNMSALQTKLMQQMQQQMQQQFALQMQTLQNFMSTNMMEPNSMANTQPQSPSELQQH